MSLATENCADKSVEEVPGNLTAPLLPEDVVVDIMPPSQVIVHIMSKTLTTILLRTNQSCIQYNQQAPPS